MAYSKQTWADNPSGGTPINATRLNHIEDGIEAASLAVVVSPTNPGLTAPGIWIQTGLGADGTDWTLWFEDGS